MDDNHLLPPTIIYYLAVWVQNGHIEDLVNQSWVRGGDIAVDWSSIEVANNVWDFSAIDSQFAFAVAAGFYIETALMVGPASPSWIYEPESEGGGGVPVTMVVSKPGGWGCGTNSTICPFPSYLDQRCK